MDVKQLRALVAVGEHQSFSAAAKALQTVQSNISTHVARLEAELDAELVDRKSMSLTQAGELVVARARRVEHEFESMVSDVTALHKTVSGKVRIGVIGTTARWLVPRLLDRLACRYPDVRLVIMDATTTSLVLQLATGGIDLAVINTPIDEIDIITVPLFDEDRIVVAPSGHPLYNREEVGLHELAEYELLLVTQGTAFRDEIDVQAAAAGVEFKPQAEVDGMRLVASLAFSGFGAAILPASAAPGFIGGDWSRTRITGLERRSVALARRRRSLPSMVEKVVGEIVTEVVQEADELPTGIHPRHAKLAPPK